MWKLAKQKSPSDTYNAILLQTLKAIGEMLIQKKKLIIFEPCVANCLDLILENIEKKISTHQTTSAKSKKDLHIYFLRTVVISLSKIIY